MKELFTYVKNLETEHEVKINFIMTKIDGSITIEVINKNGNFSSDFITVTDLPLMAELESIIQTLITQIKEDKGEQK